MVNLFIAFSGSGPIHDEILVATDGSREWKFH